MNKRILSILLTVCIAAGSSVFAYAETPAKTIPNNTKTYVPGVTGVVGKPASETPEPAPAAPEYVPAEEIVYVNPNDNDKPTEDTGNSSGSSGKEKVPDPVITGVSISPSRLTRGNNTTVTITGTDLNNSVELRVYDLDHSSNYNDWYGGYYNDYYYNNGYYYDDYYYNNGYYYDDYYYYNSSRTYPYYYSDYNNRYGYYPTDYYDFYADLRYYPSTYSDYYSRYGRYPTSYYDYYNDYSNNYYQNNGYGYSQYPLLYSDYYSRFRYFPTDYYQYYDQYGRYPVTYLEFYNRNGYYPASYYEYGNNMSNYTPYDPYNPYPSYDYNYNYNYNSYPWGSNEYGNRYNDVTNGNGISVSRNSESDTKITFTVYTSRSTRSGSYRVVPYVNNVEQSRSAGFVIGASSYDSYATDISRVFSLSPAFSGNGESYYNPKRGNITVANTVSEISRNDITPTVSSAWVQFFGTNSNFANTVYASVPLAVGDNTVYFSVRSPDGERTTYYSLVITRSTAAPI
ncbi:hypothetical protein AGMMS49975_06810 [Clostridia bacterium]|nr:hypothetical protein AGMMS49975_06810 [Clostridia bacterium]